MTSFWIIVAIAVIQLVVRGLAKAAEARKKRELQAEARRSAPPTSRAAPTPRTSVKAMPPMVDRPDRARVAAERLAEAMMQAAGVASGETPKAAKPKPDLDELRRRRVEALRRRQQATGPQAPPADAPRTASIPPVAPPRAPEIAGRAGPEPTAATPPIPAVPGPNLAALNQSRSKAAGVPAATRKMLVRPGTAGRSGRVASRLQGRLRDPQSFREAFLLAELLQPPVALRRDRAEVGG